MTAVGQPLSDTLAIARELKAQGRVRDATSLLDAWCVAHPGQPEVLWLLAQTEYLGKKFNRSETSYREAINLQPGNRYLRLDFAEALLNMGRFAKAKRVLDALSEEEARDAHALYVLAKYHYWTGDFEKAGQLVAQSRKIARHKPATIALANETRLAQAPWLSFGGGWMSDDQPLGKVEPQVSGGKYLHRLLDLQAEVSAPLFRTDSAWVFAFGAQVSNTARLQGTGTSIGAALGFFNLEGQKTGMTGSLRVVQRLPEGLSLTASTARKPYLRNLPSLDTSVFENQIMAALDWQERHGVWANLGAQSSSFGNGNQVSSAWALALSPPLRWGRFSARAGYGFSFSDARESRFFAEKTLQELLNPYDPDAAIRGIFSPYFTPENMRIHAVVANAGLTFHENFMVKLNGSYGFRARAMNPYLYLDADATGGLFIHREFLEMAFTPFEVGAKLSARLSETMTAEAGYTFTRNFFYENHSAGMSVRVVFDR